LKGGGGGGGVFFVCSQSGNHPQEDVKEMAITPRKKDLVKSGYKPEVKYKSLIILLVYFWLYNEKPNIYELGDFKQKKILFF
jgi:hypothetical protein